MLMIQLAKSFYVLFPVGHMMHGICRLNMNAQRLYTELYYIFAFVCLFYFCFIFSEKVCRQTEGIQLQAPQKTAEHIY